MDPSFHTLLTSEDEAQRLQAVSSVHAMPQTHALGPLLVARLAVERSQAVREGLVFALQRQLTPACHEGLFVLFRDDDAFLRNAAMIIFGHGDDATVAFLMEQVMHADREVRKLILDALVQIGTPAAIQGLRTALYDPAPNVRITAADYLGRVNDTDSVDVLLDMFANDKEPMLRTTILASVASMADPLAAQKLIDFQDHMELDADDETLFLPILLRFAGRVGNTDYLAGLLARIRSLPLYAEDVIQAFQNVLEIKNGQSPRDIVLFEALRGIARDRSIREDLRFSALRILVRLGRPFEIAQLEEFVNSFHEEDFREEITALCTVSKA